MFNLNGNLKSSISCSVSSFFIIFEKFFQNINGFVTESSFN